MHSDGLAAADGARAELIMSTIRRRSAVILAALALLVVGHVPRAQVPNQTLTAIPGVRVGHVTRTDRPTGCTVVLTGPDGAVAGVDVRGAAPGTRETDLLNPVNTVERVHAIVLAGGSAFGLDSASGVMQYLTDRHNGVAIAGTLVPIVPAAILFDQGMRAGGNPTAECGYQAAARASDAPVAEGSVGAGAGATVGKIRGRDRAVKGGVGSAAIALPNGLTVAALVVVNAFGDVIDPATGAVVAGARGGRGFVDARKVLRGEAPDAVPQGENTTLAIVATNARLSKTQATKVAQMAHDGFARAIAPAHTPYDGDTIFAVATGARDGSDPVLSVGGLAADAVSQAILRAVRAATGAGGVPAIQDLPR
jgi:L-aminopeptidase/D-esterase-like protein